jgi:hypothetical protein
MSGRLSGTRVAPTTDVTVRDSNSAGFDLLIGSEHGQRLGGHSLVRHGPPEPTIFADEIHEEESAHFADKEYYPKPVASEEMHSRRLGEISRGDHGSLVSYQDCISGYRHTNRPSVLQRRQD